MQLYVDGLNEYKAENPDFIGSKFIYAPSKAVSESESQTYFEIVRRLHKQFPDFLAGFDLVGQEDSAPDIVDFARNLLKLPEDIKFFLHAGETNWYGSVDDNLVNIFFYIITFLFDNLQLTSCALLFFALQCN